MCYKCDELDARNKKDGTMNDNNMVDLYNESPDKPIKPGLYLASTEVLRVRQAPSDMCVFSAHYLTQNMAPVMLLPAQPSGQASRVLISWAATSGSFGRIVLLGSNVTPMALDLPGSVQWTPYGFNAGLAGTGGVVELFTASAVWCTYLVGFGDNGCVVSVASESFHGAQQSF